MVQNSKIHMWEHDILKYVHPRKKLRVAHLMSETFLIQDASKRILHRDSCHQTTFVSCKACRLYHVRAKSPEQWCSEDYEYFPFWVPVNIIFSDEWFKLLGSISWVHIYINVYNVCIYIYINIYRIPWHTWREYVFLLYSDWSAHVLHVLYIYLLICHKSTLKGTNIFHLEKE